MDLGSKKSYALYLLIVLIIGLVVVRLTADWPPNW